MDNIYQSAMSQSTMALRFAIAGFLLLGIFVTAQALTQPCQEDFGSNLPNSKSGDSSAGLFLNLENRAQCSGTVTAYHYCYYDLSSENIRVVYFMVFRENGNEYSLVEGSHMRVSRTNAEVNGFDCDVVELDEARQFQVREDDIIAACTVDTSDSKPLSVHADSGGEGLYELSGFDTGSTDSCLSTELSTVGDSDLDERDDFALHLYAEIEVEVPSSSSVVMDVETTSTVRQQSGSLTASTGIGTPVPSTSVADMDDEVTSTAQQSDSASISTGPDATETPNPSTTSTTSSLHATSTPTMSLVYTTSSATDTEDTSPTSTFTSDRTSTLPDQERFSLSSSESNVRSSLTSAHGTASPSVKSEARSSGGDSGGPNVAAIVVPLILILVGVSVGVVVVSVLVIARRKNSKKFEPAGQIQGSTPLTIGNAVYELHGSKEPLYEDTYEDPNREHASGPVYELDDFLSLPLPPVDYGQYAETKDAYGAPTTYSESYYSTITSHTDYGQLLEQSKEEDIYGDSSPYQVPATSEDQLYAELKSFGIRSIPKHQIEITGELGSGQFGKVEKGIWATPYGIVDVAVKTLSADEDKVKFLQEAAIMAQFRHPNVVLLHGVVCEDKPLMLVVELVHNGDLRQFLLSKSSDDESPAETRKLLLQFSAQVALGMHYLSSKGFVHRDLAARNILVSKEHVCKVADFGLARDLEHGDYYVSHGGKVPVRWTAPEALQYKKYSTASDVWSYGCLLYEIWSLGRKPFGGVSNMKIVEKIVTGFRLPPPPGCVRIIYELMIQCWHPDPSLRPTFRSLLLTLLEHRDTPLTLTLPEGIHPQAGTLGAPLEAGEGLYPDLQNTYMTSS